MKVEVRLFATFRNGRWKSNIIDFKDGINIKEVLTHLNIRDDELGIALINGKHSSLDETLKDGDVLSLFPPIGGG